MNHGLKRPLTAAVMAGFLMLAGAGGASANGSMLHLDGGEACVNNGKFVMNLLENGSVSSFYEDGKNLTRDRAIDRLTFYLDYHANRKGYPMLPDQMKVIKDTKDDLHLAYIDTKGALALEYHYIIHRGENGMYCYVVARNNTGKEMKLSELRTVYRMDRNIFDHGFSGSRKGKLPLQSVMRQGKKLQDETYDMGQAGYQYTNSPIYEKYDYSNYLQTAGVWGAYGNGYGFWVIPVSNEYHPGGPLKQDLTVHYDTIVCNYLSSAHYGTGDFMAAPDWQKFYGPWYIYINKGDEQQVIADAKAKAAEEAKKWPYAWVQDPLYPTKRGAVTGTLMLGTKPAGKAQIILTKPGYDYYHDRSDYVFAAVADGQGHFSVPAVRPGEYTMQAYMQGGSVTDTYVSQPFTVGEKGLDLKTVKWQPKAERVLWQIGEADHLATGFVYGGAERNYIWGTKVPENLTYTVGQSQPSKDWYYAQTKPGDWNIDFELKDADRQGGATLKVALAGYSTGMGKKFKDATAQLLVNGQAVKEINYKNDQTVYRCGTTSGTYHLVEVPLKADQLKAGKNRITIRNQGASLLYDSILLVK